MYSNERPNKIRELYGCKFFEKFFIIDGDLNLPSGKLSIYRRRKTAVCSSSGKQLPFLVDWNTCYIIG